MPAVPTVPLKSLHVAVLGAGAAGLVAARELRQEHHRVTIFEAGPRPGGVWVYTDHVEEDDLLGRRADRRRVQSSMYSSLRTNLPRHLMAYSDFPFDMHATGSGDTRLFCGHEEVNRYLRLFAEHYGLEDCISFNTEVISARPLPGWATNGANGHNANGAAEAAYLVTTRCNAESREDAFDAVMVCNGHYTEPRVPLLPGADVFPGLQMHTHNYRANAGYEGKKVVVIGASASGSDISRDIAYVADTVLLCANWGADANEYGNAVADALGARKNVWRRPRVAELGADGSVTFEGGSREEGVDAVCYATGYLYTFPFLDGVDLTVDDNRVYPLWQHLLHPAHGSTLAFIGLPWQVVPFPLYELQARYVARLLSGRVSAPSRAQMEKDIAAESRRLKAEGIAGRYAHRLGQEQWAYDAWLAEQCGPDTPRLPKWRERWMQITSALRSSHPEDYRDRWEDAETMDVLEAEAVSWRKRHSTHSVPALQAVAG